MSEDFSKVKSGISSIKKERDQLKAGYGVLSRELSKAVQANASGIKDLSDRAHTFSASIAALDTKVSGSQERLDGAVSSVRAETAAIRKRLEEHKATIIDLGERIKGTDDSLRSLSKDISETKRSSRETDKALSAIGSSLASTSGKIAAIASSSEGRMSALDQKLSSAVALLRKNSEAQTSAVSGQGSAIASMNISLQALKKDLSTSGERIARVRETSLSNAKRLEAIGTLDSKIRHIEAVKSGLVKGVESLKDIRSETAALRQKTRDLDQRLTGADKMLDQKISERAGVIDSRLSEKTASMESEIQEKLKLLEATITGRAKAAEVGMAADLTAMSRSVTREIEDMKKVKEAARKAEGDIRDIRAASAAAKSSDAENKKDIAALAARIGSLEDLRGRVTEIEKAKDAVVAGIAATDELRQKMGILMEKHKSLDAGASSDITLLRTDVKKSASDIAKINLALAGMKKDIERSMNADILTLRKESRGSASAVARMKAQISTLQKTVDGKLSQDLSALAAEEKGRRADVTRIDLDLSGLKKTIGAGLAADVSALKMLTKKNSDAVAKAALDMAAVKKDVSAAGKLVTTLRTEHAGAKRRVAALERLTERVRAAEGAGKSLALKMEGMAPLSARIAALAKDVGSLKAASESSSLVLEDKMQYNLASVKKESAMNAAALKKVQEEIRKLSVELRSASKDVAAAKAEAKAASMLAEERAAQGIGTLKDDVAAGTAGLKKLNESLEKLAIDSNSLRKDVAAGAAGTAKVSSDIAGLLKKSQEMEKFQVRLSEMESAKESLMAALEAKLAERIAFMQKSAKQGEDALSASLAERAKKLAEKVTADVSAARKDSAAVSTSLEKLKLKVDATAKLSERIGALEAQNDGLSKTVSSLAGLKEELGKEGERIKALEERKAETAKKFSSLEELRADLAKAGERLTALEEKKTETAKSLSSLQDLRAGAAKAEAKAAAVDKDLREFRAGAEGALSELRRGVEAARIEGRDKFGTAVKAFLSAKTELSNKVGLVDMKVAGAEKRLDDISRVLARIDAIERKLDRLSDRGTEMRRSVDDLARKGSAQDRVTLVDLGREGRD